MKDIHKAISHARELLAGLKSTAGEMVKDEEDLLQGEDCDALKVADTLKELTRDLETAMLKLQETIDRLNDPFLDLLSSQIDHFPGNLVDEIIALKNHINGIPKTQAALTAFSKALKTTAGRITAVRETLTRLETKEAGQAEFNTLIRDTTILKEVSLLLTPDNILNSLINNGTFGIRQLRNAEDKISRLHKKWAGGITGADADLLKIQETIGKCRGAIDFYKQAATTMADAWATDSENILGYQLKVFKEKTSYQGDEIKNRIKLLNATYVNTLMNTQGNLGLISRSD